LPLDGTKRNMSTEGPSMTDAFIPKLALALLLSACSARTGLALSDTEGSGGSSSTTSSASSTVGAGGSGGAPSVQSCDVLVLDGPPLSPLASLQGGELLVPRLASIESDGSRAALIAMERLSTPGSPTTSVSVPLGAPWGPWPTALKQAAFHSYNEGFVTNDGVDGRFSMLTSDMPNNENVSKGMVVWFPNAGVPGAQGQFFDALPPGVPLFVASHEPEWVAGFQRSVADDLRYLSLARITSPITSKWYEDAIACATTATIAGAAIRAEKGFLLAFSNGRPFGHCLDDLYADGPPSLVQIAAFPDPTKPPSLVAELSEPDHYIFQIRMTPSKSGAWVAWEIVPFEPPFPRTIRLLRLDASGAPVFETPVAVDFGTSATPFALGTLGDKPILATTHADDSGARSLDVHVLTEDGAPLGEATIEPAPGFEMSSAVAVHGSPMGDQILVAWDEDPVDGGLRRVRVARLACAGGT